MIENYKQIGEGDYKANLYKSIVNAHTKEDFTSVGSELRKVIDNNLLDVGEVSDYLMRFMFERSKFELTKGN